MVYPYNRTFFSNREKILENVMVMKEASHKRLCVIGRGRAIKTKSRFVVAGAGRRLRVCGGGVDVCAQGLEVSTRGDENVLKWIVAVVVHYK